MDMFDRNELMRLAQQRHDPAVTIYMPTHVAGKEGQQDSIRLKNLLRTAEDRLVGGGMRAVEARAALQPANELLVDDLFWNRRGDGLAIFLSAHSFQRYRLPLRLEEHLFVSDHFFIRPVLPAAQAEIRFFLLALSQNKVRLFQATRHGIEPMEVDGMPRNMEEALNYDGADRGSQVHTAMTGRTGKQAGVFHGQGGQRERAKDDLQAYFRVVDSCVCRRLRGATDFLLLACVDNYVPIYREVNNYPHFLDQSLPGNPDHLEGIHLHERVLPLVENYVHRQRDEAAKRFQRGVGTDKSATEMPHLLPAAYAGRIDTLFLDKDASVWGRCDCDNGEVHARETGETSDQELLELAAVQTLMHRGTVYSVPRHQMPTDSPAAAVLRY